MVRGEGPGAVSGGGAAWELGLEEDSEERTFFTRWAAAPVLLQQMGLGEEERAVFTLWAAGGVPVLLKMGLGEEERVVFTRLVLLLLEVELLEGG